MYAVDRRDRVVAIEVPQCSIGAPLPVVIAGEHDLFIAYLEEVRAPGWDGESVRVVDAESPEPVVVVRFEQPYAHMFGPPNDEAFQGHPLTKRGLRPYAAFRIENSSWVRQLEAANRVHPEHRPQEFLAGKQHYIFAFHDSTFECVSASFTTESSAGTLRATATELAGLLR